MNYNATLLTSGIDKDCGNINAIIGVEKDLILVNYSDFDRDLTMSLRDVDDSNGNKDGISIIQFYEGTVLYIFQGTEFSVNPSFKMTKGENNTTKYTHSIGFTVYSKSSATRNTLMELSGAHVLAIVVDRSTGLYEIFGADRGLYMGDLSRTYNGSQQSNFYSVGIETPPNSFLKESTMGELASGIEIPNGGYLQGDLLYEL